MVGVYGENYKILFKDIREGLKNLRVILCFWNRKFRFINILIIINYCIILNKFYLKL